MRSSGRKTVDGNPKRPFPVRALCTAEGTASRSRITLLGGTPRIISELERHNCIRFISPSTGRTTDWRFDNGKEQLTYTPRGNFGVTSLEGAVAAAAAGIGIAPVSDVLAMPELRSRALQPLLIEWAVPGPSLTVVYPSSRYLTAKVRAFTDFVTEVFPMTGRR